MTTSFQQFSTRCDKWIMVCIPPLMVTGMLLTYPKGYTFATPWIFAALIFVPIIGVLAFVNYKIKLKAQQKYGWLYSQIIYFASLIIFIIVVHDAVTKTPLVALR